MPENKLTKKGSITRFRTSLYRDIVQIVCVKLLFLVIHAVVFVMFGKDESIFIAKNGMATLVSIWKLYIELTINFFMCSKHILWGSVYCAVSSRVYVLERIFEL